MFRKTFLSMVSEVTVRKKSKQTFPKVEKQIVEKLVIAWPVKWILKWRGHQTLKIIFSHYD